jgi:ankyrin repeat protein
MKKALALAVLFSTTLPALGIAGPLEDRLAESVRGNAVAAVRSLLARHANPNLRLPDKSTALTWAVDRQNEEVVRLLLSAGAKANVADIQGATPLVVACQLGNPGIVVSLVKSGADAKAVHPDGIPAFELCAGTSTPMALAAMIAKGARVNGADSQGVTPLMRAAAMGNSDNVAFLTSHGANVNAITDKGFTALFFALKSKEAKSPVILLAAGADAKAVIPADGISVAEAAALENNESFAETIVSKGVDLNRRDAQGRQLIHVAAANGEPGLVKLLLAKGVNPDVMSQPTPNAPPQRVVPAQVAGGSGKGFAVADGALKAAPVPLYPTPPLLFAAKAGEIDAMKALVAGGATTDLKASDGMNLTMAAAYSGNLAALQYALSINPDVTVVDSQGRGLMHMAVANPDAPEAEKVIAYLVTLGVKLDAKDSRGRTPEQSIQDNIREQDAVREFYNGLLKQHAIGLDRLGPADAGVVNAVNQ